MNAERKGMHVLLIEREHQSVRMKSIHFLHMIALEYTVNKSTVSV